MFGFNLKRNSFTKQIKKLTGFKPRALQLYKQALIPKSSTLNILEEPTVHNERLEYLGDAILEAIITDYLYNKFPYKDEGFLTKLRSKFVNRTHLNNLGTKIAINKLIKPPFRQNKHKKNLAGDTLEAFIGAIYLDKGFPAAKKFVVKTLIHKYTNMDALIQNDTDYKSKILEWGQQSKKNIKFLTSGESKQKNNLSFFHTSLSIHKKIISEGSGSTKRESEQNAAANAIISLNL